MLENSILGGEQLNLHYVQSLVNSDVMIGSICTSLFESFDANHDGSLDSVELHQCVQVWCDKLQVPLPTEEEFCQLFSTHDKLHDDVLHPDEFKGFFKALLQAELAKKGNDEEDGLNAILDLAKYGHWDDLFKRLEQNPEHMNARPAYRRYTVLHQAAYVPDQGVIKMLLARKADPTVLSKDGLTPAKVAANRGNTMICAILEEAMAKEPVVNMHVLSLHVGDVVAIKADSLRAGPGAGKMGTILSVDGGNTICVRFGEKRDEIWNFSQENFDCLEQVAEEVAEKRDVQGNQLFVAELFKKKPQTWGLRGDPALWEAMQADLAQAPVPERSNDLVPVLEASFQRCTGAVLPQAANTTDSVYVEKFNGGGMSGGHVSAEFWRNTGFAHVLNAHSELQG